MATSSAPARSPDHAQQQRDRDRRGEQPDAGVEPGGRRRQRAGEGDVAEGVAGEHLRPQHHEVAHQAARQRDEAAGQQCVAEELLPEHLSPALLAAAAAAVAGVPPSSGRGCRAPPARGARGRT